MSYLRTFFSLVLVTNQVLARYSGYLEVERNFRKTNPEGSTLNTAVWTRNRGDHSHTSSNDFIFRAVSQEVDNNYDVNPVENFVPQLITRERRSSETDNARDKKSVRQPCNDDNCKPTSSDEERILLTNSKFISKLKPTTLVLDYPYEVSVLLGTTNYADNNTANITKNKIVKKIIESLTDLNVSVDNTNNEIDSSLQNNDTATNETDIPVNSKRFIPGTNYDNGLIRDFNNDIELRQDLGVSTEKYQTNYPKNVGYKFNYLVTSQPNIKMTDANSKGVTERGLLKLLSILTRTFKKIIKQHEDMRKIHYKLIKENQELTLNISNILLKFDEFESKYQILLETQKKFRDIDAKMLLNENKLDQKEADLSNKMIQFINQHKKFVTQQKEFFNIQKLILTQNDKINIKQNLIAKTQTEIIHRQTNFAKLLKKLKQITLDKKSQKNTKLSVTISKPKPKTDYHSNSDSKVAYTTPDPGTTTENVKINLFSIMPPEEPKLNHDSQIMKEMTHENVDDLVYKYYFNNTFIDTAIKNGILANIMPESFTINKIKKRTKSKRTQLNTNTEKPTVLLPVKRYFYNFSDLVQKLQPRRRRWLNHKEVQKNKSILRKKYYDDTAKGTRTNEKKFVFKPLSATFKITSGSSTPLSTVGPVNTSSNKIETTPIGIKGIQAVVEKKPRTKQTESTVNPFVKMASNFCTQIGEKSSEQNFFWCVEKTLRKLKVLDRKVKVKNIIKKQKSFRANKFLMQMKNENEQNKNDHKQSKNKIEQMETKYEQRNNENKLRQNVQKKYKYRQRSNKKEQRGNNDEQGRNEVKQIKTENEQRMTDNKQKTNDNEQRIENSVYTTIMSTYATTTNIPQPTSTTTIDDDLNDPINLNDIQAIDNEITDPVPEMVVATSPDLEYSFNDAKNLTELFFPDNDELEEYEKYYDLSNEDQEGNIYYDKSIHTSKMQIDSEDRDGGASDVLPGMDTESLEVFDPSTKDKDLNKKAAIQRWNNQLYRIMRKQNMHRRLA